MHRIATDILNTLSKENGRSNKGFVILKKPKTWVRQLLKITPLKWKNNVFVNLLFPRKYIYCLILFLLRKYINGLDILLLKKVMKYDEISVVGLRQKEFSMRRFYYQSSSKSFTAFIISVFKITWNSFYAFMQCFNTLKLCYNVIICFFVTYLLNSFYASKINSLKNFIT